MDKCHQIKINDDLNNLFSLHEKGSETFSIRKVSFKNNCEAPFDPFQEEEGCGNNEVTKLGFFSCHPIIKKGIQIFF